MNSSLLRRILFTAGFCVVITVVIALGLAIWNQATREDKVDDFAFLCTVLLEDIPAVGNTPIKLSEAEVEAAIPLVGQKIKNLSSRCNKLAPIAQGWLDLLRRAEATSRNAPQGSKIFFGLAEAILGICTGQRELVGAGGQKALQETERGWNTFNEVKNLFYRKHVLAIKLAGFAPQFSGSITNLPIISCSFAEHKPGLFEIQTKHFLALVNTSGRDLHNCVIAVRFSNAKGESYLNLYFAQAWKSGEKRVTQYSDFDFPKTTVDDITRVDVNIWATETSTQLITLTRPSDGWSEPK